MSTKAPLLQMSGKLGFFGARKNVPIHGTGSLTKSHGHFMLKAALTESEAAKLQQLEAMRKRVPVEQEAVGHPIRRQHALELAGRPKKLRKREKTLKNV